MHTAKVFVSFYMTGETEEEILTRLDKFDLLRRHAETLGFHDLDIDDTAMGYEEEDDDPVS